MLDLTENIGLYKPRKESILDAKKYIIKKNKEKDTCF